MNKEELTYLINQGECETVEFKRKFGSETIETVVAFANSKGGLVILGIEDDGKVNNQFSIGNETIQQWVNEIKGKTQPSLIPDAEIYEYQGRKIVWKNYDQ